MKPSIMGILNCTPDSFSDGGQFLSLEAAMQQVDQMIADGADIIDVGGESTRPGSDPVSEEEEIRRVIPVLSAAIPKYPDVRFSIDTTKYNVAKAALECGAHFINDVSGLRKEPRFLDLCVQYNAGLIIMHSIGNPKTMQNEPTYSDVVQEVLDYLIQKATEAKSHGVKEVIIDPGIGFGKTLEHNIELLKHTSRFVESGFPVLIGASRKSMIGALLNGRETDGRLAGSLAVHFYALMKGAHIVRVHDVKETSDTLTILKALI
ncbi:MAG: dihydropteroate synthase [Balneolales bacterium]|nr:dihydropteroate synthase [Balneolales bacterium]